MEEETDTCEVKVQNGWIVIPIAKALSLHPERVKRCPECHGRVRAHSEGNDGMRAHFEHCRAHVGCSRSFKHDGSTRSRHPQAVS